MAEHDLRSRLRRLNDLGVVAVLFLLAGMVFEVVALIRALQEGKPIALLSVGLALIGIGLILGRRGTAQGPRTPRCGHVSCALSER